MKALAYRLLVLVTGQPDSMATSLADTDTHFFDEDVAPDAARVIQAPARTPEDDRYIASVRRWALYAITTGMAALAGLLELFGAPRMLP